MHGDCKNCGHWLVASYYHHIPLPHLRRVCYKCGAAWKETAEGWLRYFQVLPGALVNQHRAEDLSASLP